MMGRMSREEDVGIIPRLCRDLLQATQSQTQTQTQKQAQTQTQEDSRRSPPPPVSARIHVGYYEIYNEKIYDLLSAEEEPAVCRIREHASEGVYVEGLTQVAVAQYPDVARVLEEGLRR